MASLSFLVLLACPIGMGLMMWFMSRRHKRDPSREDRSLPDLKTEQTRIAARIAALENESSSDRASAASLTEDAGRAPSQRRSAAT